MSEEEKEAIENIDLLVHCLNYGEMKMTIASERQKEIAQELQMLLNLLNKQQKEIEDLNEIKQQICNEELITQDYVKENFIAKDRIREILKDLDEFDDYFFNVSTLKEATKNSLNRLLEEK
jgi:hypothetical protein